MRNAIKHNAACVMAFGRKSPVGDCPRCDELRNGAAPREGWQAGYFTRKAAIARADAASHAAHFAAGGPHARGCCGPVCTFGDW